MTRTKYALVIGVALLAIALSLPFRAAVGTVVDPVADIAAIVQAPDVGTDRFTGDVELSPDGTWVIFTETRRSIASNTVEKHLILRRTTGSTADTVDLADDETTARWSPDGTMLAVATTKGETDTGRIRLYTFDAGKLTLLREVQLSSGPNNSNQWVYKWAPNSANIAAIAPVSGSGAITGLDPRGGVRDEQWRADRGLRYELIRYNLQSDVVSHVSAPKDVLAEPFNGFDWSPKSDAVVVVASTKPNDYGYHTKLVTYDLASGTKRTLVEACDCRNDQPQWSPDGAHVLFSSNAGRPDYFIGGWPSVVDVASGRITRYANVLRGQPLRWTSDGRSFVWQFNDQMATRLARVRLGIPHEVETLPEPATPDKLHSDANWTFDAAGRNMAFVRSTFIKPADVYDVPVTPDGHPAGAPIKLTHNAEIVDFASRLRLTDARWKSRDGKFVVHGLLLTPASANLRHPLPTVLYIFGGPGMVRKQFGEDGPGYNALALALHGYAVLMPNTRGRSGYGEAFLSGIRDQNSYGRVPLNDAIDGVNSLIREGISDPKRLAVTGFSYGGYLTEYAVTQTTRFKAAVVYEGNQIDLSDYFYFAYSPDFRMLLSRDLYGVSDPFTRSQKARILAESPGFNADLIRTPTLLLFGAKSGATRVGEPFYFQLQHFKVPSELYVYDEAHGFEKPAGIADSIQRTVNWIDRWTLHK